MNQDVNESICKTILSGDVNAFSMLNNGVTIVASTISIPGDIATIEDYQIVNGCQTSNILIDNMDVTENIDELIIPVRIIGTKDENLKNEITEATNSQTAIKKEQLEALSTFQNSLVYERRTGQYRNSDIQRNRIISISTQIKTIAAMFLNEPSAVSGQYGAVVKRFGNKSDKKYRRSRYHAMMLFRIVVSEGEMPQFNQRKMEPYCQNILDILNDDYKCEKIYKGIIDFIISRGQDIDIENRKCFERKETTEYILSQTRVLIEYLRTANIIT